MCPKGEVKHRAIVSDVAWQAANDEEKESVSLSEGWDLGFSLGRVVELKCLI